MALPKKNKKQTINNINIFPDKEGNERREQLMSESDIKSTYFPPNITLEDIDKGVFDYFNSEKPLFVSSDKNKIPIFFITNERWAELRKTWKFVDNDQQILMPYIIIKRSEIEKGTKTGDGYNYAQQRKFTYIKIPNFDGTNTGYDIYKIPQPTPVNLTFEIELYTRFMKDKNMFDEKIMYLFNSRQCYIFIKGHPMRMTLENTSQENNFQDLDNNRFYVKKLSIKLFAYLQFQDTFEIVPSVKRTIIMSEIE